MLVFPRAISSKSFGNSLWLYNKIWPGKVCHHKYDYFLKEAVAQSRNASLSFLLADESSVLGGLDKGDSGLGAALHKISSNRALNLESLRLPMFLKDSDGVNSSTELRMFIT
jgi:hypothetical protein